MTVIDKQLDDLHEQAMRQICERMEADTLRGGLERIDKMPRNKLLQAHGWDNCKSNTERLRKRARMRWIASDPHFDVWV